MARHLNIIKVITEIQLFVILLCCVVLQTHEQGFETEVVTEDDYGTLQVMAALAVLPFTIYLVLKELGALLKGSAEGEVTSNVNKDMSKRKGKKASKTNKKKSKKTKGSKASMDVDMDNPVFEDETRMGDDGEFSRPKSR